MIRINLAPPAEPRRCWRPVPLAAAAASIAAIVALVWWYAALVRSEGRLAQEVASLDREVVALREALGRDQTSRDAVIDLGRRTALIQQLASGRDVALGVLDSLLDLVPSDLWLTALEGRGVELRAAGSAHSARAVADFMASLRSSGAFKDVEIVAARQDLGKAPTGPVSFEITCRFGP